MADDRRTLTNRQGHPVADNQNQRTVGDRGPATTENYQFLEKISHFDRERIPERVVHAAGPPPTATSRPTAPGATSPSPGTRAPSSSRSRASAPTWPCASPRSPAGGTPRRRRDPRGFAVKFYTEDGNWDLVGNNLGVFFIRDAIKFPDFIHSQKPDPVTFRQDANRQFDFISQSPESMHTVMLLMGPRGVPHHAPTSGSTSRTRRCS